MHQVIYFKSQHFIMVTKKGVKGLLFYLRECYRTNNWGFLVLISLVDMLS